MIRPKAPAVSGIRWFARFTAFVVGASCLAPSVAAEPGEASRAVDYIQEVKPLLATRCYACHGPLKRKAGLRLDTAAAMLKGGDSGPAIVPGQSEESLILEAVSGHDGWRMPPEGEGTPLSPEEIQIIRSWIDQGATAPSDEKPQSGPLEHWAFVAPRRPAVPKLAGPAAHWARTPIDAFLAERHQRLGLKPSPPATPAEQVRRVYLDLVGLVPLPHEVEAFESDPSDLAYERLVDRLLASPQYGERWGRHWMDVWRYSDWDGFGSEIRESQPHIWRWRDWIVESLNADRGYDEMVVQMLAGDEVAPDDPEVLRATGFLARNWYKFNRNVWLDNTIEHTAKAFLGLTMNCARCHDHKYDPIDQTDYYAFRAFFEPHSIRIDQVPGQPDTQNDGFVRAYDSELEAKTLLFVRGDEKRPVTDRPLVPGLPTLFQRAVALGPITPIPLPPTARYPALRDFVQDDARARAASNLQSRKDELSRAEAAVQAAIDPEARAKASNDLALARARLEAARSEQTALEARIAADRARFQEPADPHFESLARTAGKAERQAALLAAEARLLETEILLTEAERASSQAGGDQQLAAKVSEARTARDQARADLKTRRIKAMKDEPDYTPLGTIYPAASSGRRRALARWIVDRKNPLTARVAINHIWMRHMGRPLVPTEFDFGLNGKPPEHPELLDWLAVELMESGWKIKAIHRLIVTSSVYRARSAAVGPDDPNLAIDPSNREYWRMNPRRMEAELVRDNLLHVAGTLDLSLGGPDLDPEAGLTSPRRSLYFRHAKEKRVTFLRLFDSANVLSCYRRPESVVPQQALALANSSLSLAQARRLAALLERQLDAESASAEASSSGDRGFVAAAFRRILGRRPTEEELGECLRFLADLTRLLEDPSQLSRFTTGTAPAVPPSEQPARRARESLVHALLNHNDFVTIR